MFDNQNRNAHLSLYRNIICFDKGTVQSADIYESDEISETVPTVKCMQRTLDTSPRNVNKDAFKTMLYLH